MLKSTRPAQKGPDFTVTGGVNIGWANATWPFGKLFVSADKVCVSSRGLLGSYSFAPSEVVAIEPYGSIPFLSSGVRVVHTNKELPERIIFWHLGSRDELIARIKKTGFVATAASTQIPQRSGIPFRWTFLFAMLVIWNGLFYADMSALHQPHPKPGPFTLLALALLFFSALGIQNSTQFQAIALKPGRFAAEVRPVVRIIMVISGIITVAFSVIIISELSFG